MREEPWFSLTYYAPPEEFDFALLHEFAALGLAVDAWLLAHATFHPGPVGSYDLWVCFGDLPGGAGFWPLVLEEVAAPPAVREARSRLARAEVLLRLVVDRLTNLSRRYAVALPPEVGTRLRLSELTLPEVPGDLRTPGRRDMERMIRKAKGEQR